ncbi:MAG: single-stranded-DNA-specific exonuclease, single-stranded-DNA-specific exonuclease [candidate division CPR2 bacterium GW2011_GWC1_39_9]|uniref:Single-stranded-DNA-specific exonuclease RecJ n=1 Tax=candidate division CPR2 bacterium GW2011_GWC2_39_10 TaxID=1618345 RepID=A0A0G0M1Y2_UNCC2|nr:MAG: Single-stranded-DNA-specific exonuclease RecJ [candidate division CPR2 bacterium GW2011_GWC2_39_10]KKR36085.1 MAG: single-stranded-DNA-specific exonuclease, single-stranded-DNA-specific exonuclease [candidate division CPR2 bacterium GW2011_GWC1_39_9]
MFDKKNINGYTYDMQKIKAKKWIVSPEPSINKLDEVYDEITAMLLYNRGIEIEGLAREFLDPDFYNIPDPMIIPGMKEGTSRIIQAIEKKEKICIYGDYDVDGVTATALLMSLFSKIGMEVEYYIPSRIDEGYGLSKKVIQKLAKDGVNLIITVDCGITAVDEVKEANSLGVDVIITDHHEPPTKLPQAISIIHPALKGSKYLTKNLAGVGVAYKLAQAIMEQINYSKKVEFLKWSLDLVALGTVADLVPLLGENRVLVYYGLIVLSKTQRIGLKKLFEVSSINPKELDSLKIAFQLAPRINAAGRLSHAKEGLELLLTEDEERAEVLAEHLSKLNSERQKKTEKILMEAFGKIDNLPDDMKFIVLHSPLWSSGIIGIVASKIVEAYARPVILLEENGEVLHGSGRSIATVDLYKILSKLESHFINFGGHKMAAGVTLNKSNYENFLEQLHEISSQLIDSDDLVNLVRIEVRINFSQIDYSLLETIDKFKPFGNGNQAPIFMTEKLLVKYFDLVGKNKNHIKLLLVDESGSSFNAIGFGMGDVEIAPGSIVDIAYKLHLNEWNNKKNIDLVIEDICIKK